MDEEVIGLLHPGEMGAAIGRQLVDAGHVVLWASGGRSGATVRRADEAGLTDVQSVGRVLAGATVVLSICPPAAAVDVAQSVVGFTGTYVDANAIAPATARQIAAMVSAGGAVPVDGGIIGSPPSASTGTRLYLSGVAAARVAALFQGSAVDPKVLAEKIGPASALKMCYAAYTKGRAALLLAIRATAEAQGVDDALLTEWAMSQPDLPDASRAAARAAAAKGARWIAEMEEIAGTFAANGVPAGFHESAAEMFRRVARANSA